MPMNVNPFTTNVNVEFSITGFFLKNAEIRD